MSASVAHQPCQLQAAPTTRSSVRTNIAATVAVAEAIADNKPEVEPLQVSLQVKSLIACLQRSSLTEEQLSSVCRSLGLEYFQAVLHDFRAEEAIKEKKKKEERRRRIKERKAAAQAESKNHIEEDSDEDSDEESIWDDDEDNDVCDILSAVSSEASVFARQLVGKPLRRCEVASLDEKLRYTFANFGWPVIFEISEVIPT